MDAPTGDANPSNAEEFKDAALTAEALSSAGEASALGTPAPTGTASLATTPSGAGDVNRPARVEAADTPDSRPASTVAPAGTPNAMTARVGGWGGWLGVVMGGSQVVEEGGAEPAEGGSA
ncbi:hypothetical protein Aple_073350 [Acrocarpospora pleiomorpha]|uniref:Uncharacterized protein n=1 Tax=Acrocarpospora pleiomorpha TaxID=90975 RepID=A0A5M3XU75_9ACTN|nr:hypothetical protein Aple_073350 [Acrocarpospora pleiomorpha]